VKIASRFLLIFLMSITSFMATELPVWANVATGSTNTKDNNTGKQMLQRKQITTSVLAMEEKTELLNQVQLR
jgi:hypothetical protein